MAVDYATLKKGGFMRQKQKNNFSLRLRVVGGNLTAKQLAKIAEVAEKFGDGHVHLTSRQSVEIPFVKLDQIEEVKATLAEGDVEPGVCGPRAVLILMRWQRNWMSGTLHGSCPTSLSSASPDVRTTA